MLLILYNKTKKKHKNQRLDESLFVTRITKKNKKN